jgi:hypothetical protein
VFHAGTFSTIINRSRPVEHQAGIDRRRFPRRRIDIEQHLARGLTASGLRLSARLRPLDQHGPFAASRRVSSPSTTASDTTIAPLAPQIISDATRRIYEKRPADRKGNPQSLRA